MTLFFSDEVTIKEVNKSFQRQFPYLKLGFYNYNPLPEQILLWENSFHEHTRIGNIAGDSIPTIIEFDPMETVAELEQKFESQLGLFVKVYRKRNGVWFETSQSAHLDLDKQNRLGNRPFMASYNAYTLYL